MKLAYEVYVPDVVKANGCPIILLHSILETRTTWKALGQPLAEKTGRKVYAIDARNHGDSPYTDQYNFDLMGEDLFDFMTEHEIPKTILIGHSMGGKVAIVFSLKHPEKVEKLIVEDVPVRQFKHRLSNMVPLAISMARELFEGLKEVGGKAEQEQFIRETAMNFSHHLMVTPEVIQSYDLSMLPIRWNGKFYEENLNLSVAADAVFSDKLQHTISGRYEGDALFLYGTLSQFKVDQDPLVEKHFPRAVKLGFSGVGHFIHESLPKEFLEEVVQFINRDNTLKSKF